LEKISAHDPLLLKMFYEPMCILSWCDHPYVTQ
jgi:hypothetical protein